jgi:hypothetical protein
VQFCSSCLRQLATSLNVLRGSTATLCPASSSYASTSTGVAGRLAGHLAGLVGGRPGSAAAAASSSHRPVSPFGLGRRLACASAAAASTTIATANWYSRPAARRNRSACRSVATATRTAKISAKCACEYAATSASLFLNAKEAF